MDGGEHGAAAAVANVHGVGRVIRGTIERARLSK